MRAHKDAPTHWGQRLGHRQHSVLLFRLQWKNLPFDPGAFPTPRKEAARECCASALTKRDRQWINAHHLCVSAAFLSATWSIHSLKLFYSTGNALPSRAFSFQTPPPHPHPHPAFGDELTSLFAANPQLFRIPVSFKGFMVWNFADLFHPHRCDRCVFWLRRRHSAARDRSLPSQVGVSRTESEYQLH